MSSLAKEGWGLREVEFGSENYRKFLDLRFEELRRPLGMAWSLDELQADEDDRHFGLFGGGGLLGTLVARELGGGIAKLRQIAVTGARQGEGLGRRLMDAVEARLALDGIELCELNSRVTVAVFYEKTGYARVGEVFEEIGIPHVKMRKGITTGG